MGIVALGLYGAYQGLNLITDTLWLKTKNYWHLGFALIGIGLNVYASSVGLAAIMLAMLFLTGLLREQLPVFRWYEGDTKMSMVFGLYVPLFLSIEGTAFTGYVLIALILTLTFQLIDMFLTGLMTIGIGVTSFIMKRPITFGGAEVVWMAQTNKLSAQLPGAIPIAISATLILFLISR
ncbi:hypothetical protein DH09_00485 (plasmid) [Bacillaceae bacterium JMAK1]|nr:hypothetical protein DH09_00485 [Bacillaceae bacterium JMAK1]